MGSLGNNLSPGIFRRCSMHLVYTKKRFWLYSFPMIFFYTIFIFVPIAIAFWYSLTNFRGIGEYGIVGIENFINVLKDKLFYRCLSNTLKSTFVSMLISIPLSFCLALLVQKNSLSSTIYRSVLFSPYVMGGIVVGLVWTFILDPSKGFINAALTKIGLENWTQQWIGGTILTPYCVGVITVWTGTGFSILLWLNGIKQISGDILEAGLIDGATKWQQIRYITLPLLKETLKMQIVLGFTGGLKIFDIVQSLTGGGPNHFSETLVSYMYNITFTQRRFGYGMAIAIVEFFFTMAVTLFFMRVTRAEVE